MPIFELDEGRPRLVQPMQPLAGSFAQECEALLTHHLTAIAGEPLFPVRSRTGAPEHASLPALLALDATGRPVVLEIVQVVDDDAVVSALRHAGAAARMTTTDLRGRSTRTRAGSVWSSPRSASRSPSARRPAVARVCG